MQTVASHWMSSSAEDAPAIKTNHLSSSQVSHGIQDGSTTSTTTTTTTTTTAPADQSSRDLTTQHRPNIAPTSPQKRFPNSTLGRITLTAAEPGAEEWQ
jgi:hypothetical protein